MAYKMRLFHTDEFTNQENGTYFSVRVYSQTTRYGFRHVAEIYQDWFMIAQGKMCYYNRTWESFCGESAIKTAIKHAPKDLQQMLTEVFVVQHGKAEAAKCEAWVQRMKEMHDSLSDGAKKRLAKASENVNYTSAEQIESVLKVTKVFDLMGVLK